MNLDLMEQIAANDMLEEAFGWLCKRRQTYSHNDDVWRVRSDWAVVKPKLQQELRSGTYSFSSLARIHRINDCLELWTALDSLVLKAMAIVLTKLFGITLSSRCFHLAGTVRTASAISDSDTTVPWRRSR